MTGSERLEPRAARHAVRAAERFAYVWSTPDQHWHESLAELASPTLAASLAQAVPIQPPPDIEPGGEVLIAAPRWARVLVPTDRGDVVLDLTRIGGDWLVSAVDWRPA